MGDGDDSVNVLVAIGDAGQACLQLSDESARARGGSQQNDHVAGPHPPPACSCIALEVALFLMIGDLCAGPEGGGVQDVGLDMIGKVRLGRQFEVERAHTKRVEHFGVAHIFTERNWPRRQSKRQLPGKQRTALRDGRDREAVPLQRSVIQCQSLAVVIDLGACRQRAGGDGDIVAGQRQARYLVKGQASLLRSVVRVRWWGHGFTFTVWRSLYQPE